MSLPSGLSLSLSHVSLENLSLKKQHFCADPLLKKAANQVEKAEAGCGTWMRFFSLREELIQRQKLKSTFFLLPAFDMSLF